MRIPSSSSSSKRQAPAAGGEQQGGGSGKNAVACGSKVGVKRGPWTAEEDEMLADYIRREGEGRWRTLPNKAGLRRCGKSCRLRWMNYLRPSVKRGHITPDEEDLILRLHRLLGNRWSLIAGRIPGRTDNEIKNYWNTHLSKKLMSQGIDPKTHRPIINNHPSTNKATNKQHKEPQNVHARHGDAGIMANDASRFAHRDKKHDIKLGNNLRNSEEGKVKTNVNEAHNMIDNCSPDDAFSSFLNLLINDDMFDETQHENRVQEGQHDDQQSSCLI